MEQTLRSSLLHAMTVMEMAETITVATLELAILLNMSM